MCTNKKITCTDHLIHLVKINIFTGHEKIKLFAFYSELRLFSVYIYQKNAFSQNLYSYLYERIAFYLMNFILFISETIKYMRELILNSMNNFTSVSF